ncbi:MAG: methyl-accepting chemotaxis protein [Deltaproteobacteria bacterium]|nr:methyl-accepting chemotaxis protein [Deltaproteobacteria bacterium]
MITKLRIGTRLMVSYAVIVALMIITGVYSLNRLDYAASRTTYLYEHPFNTRKSIRDATLHFTKMHYTLNGLAAAGDMVTHTSLLRALEGFEREFTSNMGVVKKAFLGKQSDVDDVMRIYGEWQATRDRVVAAVREKHADQAKQIVRTTESDLMTRMDKEMTDILGFADNKAAEFVKESQDTARSSYILVMTLLLASIVLTILLAVILTRSITRPLNQAVNVAERVSAGDLTVAVPGTGERDELGLLMQTFQRMVDSLRSQTLAIQEGVNVLAASAGEILSSTSQVASAATETASAVNETTATVEEVKQASQLASQKVRMVADEAQRSLHVSNQGKRSAEDVIQGMNRIREQMETIAESIVSLSEQGQAIGEIIATVNDLAEQSNLLAVNAAIEAAKAGEHGKGFAVVAHEVRSLAVQSKEATAQVRSILNDIQKATNAAVMATEQGSKVVEAGEKQSGEAGEAIRLLADNIAESANASTQIAASSHQQMIGMEQVAQAMENIKEGSTLSVTSTRQAEQSAQGLHELGQKLKGLVERFKL